MAYDAKAVANYFLDLAKAKNTSLTPMKLQKLIFMAHGWHLAFYSEPLIVDQVEAWQFGPVVPSVYHEFKHERSGAISSIATEFDMEEFDFVVPFVPTDDERARKIMDRVWAVYGHMSAMKLSNLTHLPDTPWAKARAGYPGDARGIPIENSLIREYYKDQLDKNIASRQAAA